MVLISRGIVYFGMPAIYLEAPLISEEECALIFAVIGFVFVAITLAPTAVQT